MLQCRPSHIFGRLVGTFFQVPYSTGSDKNAFSTTLAADPNQTSLWALCTVKNIHRFHGKITGNQLPVHFPLFFTGARKHFQESGTER